VEEPLVLACHPSTPTDVVRRIEARVTRTRGVLVFTFSLDGALRRLRIPAPRAPRIAPMLWQHTCFEAFIALPDLPAYHEFNWAPSGEWAAHAFRRYRDGRPLDDETLAPAIAVRYPESRLELEATVQLGRLSAAHSDAVLRLALAAVVEEADGTLSYWALRHPPGRPDFHHAAGFAVRLERPTGAW